jgi:hypothetical protein
VRNCPCHAHITAFPGICADQRMCLTQLRFADCTFARLRSAGSSVFSDGAVAMRGVTFMDDDSIDATNLGALWGIVHVGTWNSVGAALERCTFSGTSGTEWVIGLNSAGAFYTDEFPDSLAPFDATTNGVVPAYPLVTAPPGAFLSADDPWVLQTWTVTTFLSVCALHCCTRCNGLLAITTWPSTWLPAPFHSA